jgi:hypothetical protein
MFWIFLVQGVGYKAKLCIKERMEKENRYAACAHDVDLACHRAILSTGSFVATGQSAAERAG